MWAKKEVARHYRGMDRPLVWQVLEATEEERKLENTDCKVIYGVPLTFTV